MENNDSSNTLGSLPVMITLSAMVAAALASELLSGIVQAVVLAICIAAIGGGVLVHLLSQRVQTNYVAHKEVETIQRPTVATKLWANEEAVYGLRAVDNSAQPISRREVAVH